MNINQPLSILLIMMMSLHNLCGMENLITPKSTEWDSEKYSKNSSPQYLAALRVLALIKLEKYYKILDVGCGGGKISKRIAEMVPEGKVKGIDPSENQINFACTNNTMPNLSFNQADITEFVTEEKFDYVFSFASFAWIKNQQKALTNIANVLSPSGKFVAGVAHSDSAYLRARFNMLTADKWKQYFEGYEVPYYPCNEQKMNELLNNAGLTPEVLKKSEHPYVCKTREELIKFMQAIPAQLDKIPEALHSEFLNDTVNEYLTLVPQREDGSIELCISGLVVVASKSSS